MNHGEIIEYIKKCRGHVTISTINGNRPAHLDKVNIEKSDICVDMRHTATVSGHYFDDANGRIVEFDDFPISCVVIE